jgi:hypothetical protein
MTERESAIPQKQEPVYGPPDACVRGLPRYGGRF